MNAGEYRARLERLGLSAGAAARLFCVADRTHRSWASGERAIPDTVERVFVMYDALVAARDFAEWITIGPRGKRVLGKITQALRGIDP